jgi:hypothetical protein
MGKDRAPRVGLLLASGLWLLLGTLGAGASSFFPEFYHGWNPRPGGWSTYHVRDAVGEEADVTFAVVEEGGALWLELRTASEGVPSVAAFRLQGDPVEDGNVLAVRARDGEGPAVELDRAALERLLRQGGRAFGPSALSIGPRMGKLEGLPDEAVTVGKRKVSCRHLKVVGAEGVEAEVWLSDEVVPFGLVKLVSGDESLVLTDFGKGARPSLKGPFIPLEVP